MKKFVVAALSALLAQTGVAIAQEFPSKPIQIIVPFSAGGNTDVTARTIAPALGEVLGQPVVVENRVGAGGMIGAEAAMSAEPDGHTLMMGTTSTLTVGPNLYPNWPYDPVEGITPITNIQVVPFALVVKSDSEIQSVEDLLQRVKANPGQITMAHTGIGGSNHLVAELFKLLTDTDFLYVPYQGGGPAMTALLGDQVDVYFDQVSTTVPHVQGGRVRALAVTSPERWPALPDVPTFAELGIENFEVLNITGLAGPAGMDPGTVETIRAAVAETLQNPQVREALDKLGVQVVGSSPDEFAAIISKDLARWADVIERANVTVQQ